MQRSEKEKESRNQQSLERSPVTSQRPVLVYKSKCSQSQSKCVPVCLRIFHGRQCKILNKQTQRVNLIFHHFVVREFPRKKKKKSLVEQASALLKIDSNFNQMCFSLECQVFYQQSSLLVPPQGWICIIAELFHATGSPSLSQTLHTRK